MSRIGKGYEARFRALLQQAAARRLEEGVGWLVKKAERSSARDGMPMAEALRGVCDELRAKAAFGKKDSGARAIRFWCDAGLGGLARWLRAAGYDALWQSDIADDALIREAREAAATIQTTDAMLMERRLLRERVVQSFWLPPTLAIAEQLGLVFREYGLKVGQPRCMSDFHLR